MTRRAGLALLAWFVLVLACSTGVWMAIRTAGQDVTGASSGSQTPSTVVTPGATPSPSPTQVRRIWHGGAGSVATSCSGAAIAFQGAQANSGWRVEVGDRGPGVVQVHYQRGEQGEVRVKARCTGGTPRYAVSSSGETGEGGDD